MPSEYTENRLELLEIERLRAENDGLQDALSSTKKAMKAIADKNHVLESDVARLKRLLAEVTIHAVHRPNPLMLRRVRKELGIL